MFRFAWPVALVFALSLAAPPARADALPASAPSRRAPSAPPFAFDLDLAATGAFAGLDGRALDDSAPFRRADLRVRGGGSLAGVTLRETFRDPVWRGGLEASFFHVGGLALVHGPLAPDLHLGFRTPYAVSASVFFGRSFHAGRWSVYGDLRLGVSSVRTRLDVRSNTLGFVQTLERPFNGPIFGPRLGVRLRATDWLSFDVSGAASPFGGERLSVSAGLVFTVAREPGK
jgi:hypothetical protein